MKKYQKLYNRLQEIISTYSPCKFDDEGKCGRSQLFDLLKFKKNNQYNCCGDPLGLDTDAKCRYLSDSGCTVECLFCKTHFCEFAKANLPEEILLEIEEIKKEAGNEDLLDFRTPKEITALRKFLMWNKDR